MNRHVVKALPWAASAIAAAAFFQPTAAAQDPSQPVASFRAGVELVRLDVRVTDDRGRPIRDLRQDEVEVVEAGDSRPVVFFQHVEEPAAPYAEVASRTIGGEVSTNRGAARGHLYVLVFDQLHITPGNEQRARVAAERFVRTRLRPGDRIALYAIPGPGPEVAFTPDGRRVATELAKVRGMAAPQTFGAIGSMTPLEAFQIVRGNETVLQRVADRLQTTTGATDLQRRSDPSTFESAPRAQVELVKEDARKIANIADGDTRRVLAILSDILRTMRGIEGRKTVLLVSEGFFGDRLPREIQNVAAAAAESYSVVYAFDVNRRELDITADAPVGADQATAIHDRISPLGTLAAETGGQLVIDAGQRADDAFGALADESQDYYLVGFTPKDSGTGDRSAYRPVTVRVRRSGARVSARTGFVLSDTATRVGRHQALEKALTAPFAQQAVPVEYTTYVLHGSTAGLQRVIVSLAAELPIGSGNGADAADVVFVVRAVSDGRVAASGHDSIPLPDRRTSGASTGTGTYRVQFELSAGDYLMRAVVREPGGLVGSADRRFTVRPLDGPALTSGDLVVSSVRGDLPVRPAAYVGDGLSGVVELYGRTAEQLRDARVTIDLVPVGERTAVVSGSADLLDMRATAAGAAREARLEVPLEGVAPGTYVVRARVTSAGETASEVVREIEVRQGRRPATVAGNTAARFDPVAVATSTLARSYVDRVADAKAPLDRLAAGDYAAAIAGLQAHTNDAEAAFFLGWAFHGAGDDRQAISAWRRAAYLNPALVPAHLALAEVYEELAQPQLAIQALRAGLAALPQSPELLDRLSRLERR